MGHDNRSEGNRVGDTFVYAHLSCYDGERVLGAGFYRVDVHPDAAIKFGAGSFDDWESFTKYEDEHGTPDLFIILSDKGDANQFGI